MVCLKRNSRFNILNVKQLVFTGCFAVLFACVDLKSADPTEQELAKVGVYTLFLSDVLADIQLTPEKDSAAQVKLYINNWVKNHVVLQKAETELYSEEKKFSKQLEEYRNSLMRYAYEQKYVRDNLDTVVGEKEIAAFYNQNARNFELKEDVVRVRYVLLNKNKIKFKAKLKSLLTSNTVKAKKEFITFCAKNKLDCYWNDSTWVFFDEFRNIVPLKSYNNEDFLRSTKYYECNDSLKLDLMYFTNFKIKDSASPIDFEREKIKRIILNQRKLKLIEEMEIKVYDEALKEGDVEVY